MEVDDNVEDGEIRKTSPPSKEPSLESLSLSEEEGFDLVIKPPQHVHKVHKKSKHSSSSKRHGSSSEHRKKHHHSRSHREERHRHHREKAAMKDDASRSREESSRNRRREHELRREERERLRKEEQRLIEEQRLREEKEHLRREEEARRNREIERDLRDKLEKRRHVGKEKDKEKDKEREEREQRRQRLMEAERVKETYKKDIEERRMRREARERSRSRERKLEAEQAEAAALAAAAQAEMEKAGLVVVSDESCSPVLLESKDEEEMELETEIHNGQLHSSESSPASDSSCTGSGREETEEEEVEQRGSERVQKVEESPKESTPPPAPEEPPEESGVEGVAEEEEMELAKDTLPPYLPAIQGCRSVEEFQCLNRIEEGTYGVVYRARDKRTEDIVALKRLKMEKEKEGFPITSLREINTLLKAQHPNIVTVREIVVGSNMDKIFIVMDYVEHDLKSLMETMKLRKQHFLPAEIKCLMRQLLRAVAHLHDNWILHRDLKTSNLLFSHKGVLKVGDFGLAREYGSPLKPYTPIVVTLWYRAPELLLGAKEYSIPIDMWSVGCIFAELLAMEPLFTGKSEQDQLNRIFRTLGTPNERIWPGYNQLPTVQKVTFAEFPVSTLRTKFPTLTETGFNLLNGFLTYNPAARLSAESALKHEYFTELPLPIDPAMFPSWPAKSEGNKVKKICSPKPPSGGRDFKQLEDTDEGFHMGAMDRNRAGPGPGFSLKF